MDSSSGEDNVEKVDFDDVHFEAFHLTDDYDDYWWSLPDQFLRNKVRLMLRSIVVILKVKVKHIFLCIPYQMTCTC